MIGTSMSHPFDTLLIYGYSKTMQKSTSVRILAFRPSQLKNSAVAAAAAAATTTTKLKPD